MYNIQPRRQPFSFNHTRILFEASYVNTLYRYLYTIYYSVPSALSGFSSRSLDKQSLRWSYLRRTNKVIHTHRDILQVRAIIIRSFEKERFRCLCMLVHFPLSFVNYHSNWPRLPSHAPKHECTFHTYHTWEVVYKLHSTHTQHHTNVETRRGEVVVFVFRLVLFVRSLNTPVRVIFEERYIACRPVPTRTVFWRF